jgi:hypothetical protein
VPAKAYVPVETLPKHPPLSGAWPPPTGLVDTPPASEVSDAFCRSGPWPRKRWFRLKRFQGVDRFRGQGPLLQGPWMRHSPWEWAELL